METPVNAPFGEKVKIELAKLKTMSFKEKLAYIWDYYKYFIIGIVIILIIIGSIINSRILNPAPETALFISLNGGFVTMEQVTDLTSALEERLIDENANEEVLITQTLIIEEDFSVSSMNNTRIVAMIAAGQLDAFINDAQTLDMQVSNGYIIPLGEGILSNLKSINSDAFKTIEENFVYISYETDEGSSDTVLAGVNIGKSPLLIKLGFLEQDLYYCFAVNTSNLDTATKALITFFE